MSLPQPGRGERHQAVPVVVGFGEEAQPSSVTQEGATSIPAAICYIPHLGHPQGAV